MVNGGAQAIDPVGRVAARIKMLRRKRRLTQAALARDARVSREYLARIEAGRHDPTLGVLNRIATALHISLATLVK